MPAPYLSPCFRCHITGCTAKADLVMLHPGQTFLTLSLANLSIHTLLLIFYHECWLLQLLLLDLFVINLVFSWVHPVPDARIISLHHCPLRYCYFQNLPLVSGFKVMHLLVYMRASQTWWVSSSVFSWIPQIILFSLLIWREGED